MKSHYLKISQPLLHLVSDCSEHPLHASGYATRVEMELGENGVRSNIYTIPIMNMKTFLHVGCGSKRKDQTTRGFHSADWQELRLDIDPSVRLDNVGTMIDMSDVSVDAVFSSHNIEHLYPSHRHRADTLAAGGQLL